MNKQIQAKRKQNIDKSRKLFDQIIQLQTQQSPVEIPNDKVSLSVHFIFKAIPVFLVFFDELTALFFEEQYTAQLIIILIVLQFWITKNFTGRRMLGYRWFFGDDQYGCERLMFECRANRQYIDIMQPRLFYIIQVVYIVVAWLLFFEAIFIIPNAVRIEHRKIQMNCLLMISGVANLLLFYIVSDSVAERQDSLRRQVGIEYLRTMQLGSIISHY